jgi:sugar (pentulose or hexulose) kinase
MFCCLGIDFGTSGARAILIDGTGQVRFQSSAPWIARQPPQWVTEWQSVLWGLIWQIPASYRASIQAIAINGTSSTVLLCDRNGHPLDSPLLYNDARGARVLPRLQAFFAQPAYAQAPCQNNVLNATSSLVKLLWWQQRGLQEQAGSVNCNFADAGYLMHQADWLAFLLHGQPGISDYHNCLKLGYDVTQLCYPDWMEELGILPLLPLVVAPGTAIAPLQSHLATELGLPQDCLICAGTTDSIAAFLASGASVPGQAVTSLGSTLVLKLLSQTPVENGNYGIYSHRLGDLWLVGGASNTGGAVLQQFFTTPELQILSPEIACDRPSPLNYYPLTRPGERFPINDPDFPPCLEPRPENPVEFLHGLLESMARIEAQGYALLQELGATPLTQVYTAGGGASNPAWTAIRDRHLQVPILSPQHTQAAYGTARLALESLLPSRLS